MILAANDRPRYKDVAGAVKERCIFVSCPNHRLRGERDPKLFAKLREAAEQFKQEALLLAGLKHPSLPSIYDHFSQHGRWYLVMDFIEGETLVCSHCAAAQMMQTSQPPMTLRAEPAGQQSMCEAFIASRRSRPSPTSRAISSWPQRDETR